MQVVRGTAAGDAPATELDDEQVRQWIRGVLQASMGDNVFNDMADRFAKHLISEALSITGGNRSQAARLLGLSRPTLLAKIDKYGIKIETAVKSE